MIRSILFLLIIVTLSSCESFPNKVQKNKEKFIQVAKENSKSYEITDISSIYENAKENNTEGKIKFLEVDNIETRYVDSMVVFKKSEYRVLYDFAIQKRALNELKTITGLKDLRIVDDRLYIGHE